MLVPIELINGASDEVAFSIELYQSKKQHELDWSIDGKTKLTKVTLMLSFDYVSIVCFIISWLTA